MPNRRCTIVRVNSLRTGSQYFSRSTNCTYSCNAIVQDPPCGCFCPLLRGVLFIFRTLVLLLYFICMLYSCALGFLHVSFHSYQTNGCAQSTSGAQKFVSRIACFQLSAKKHALFNDGGLLREGIEKKRRLRRSGDDYDHELLGR